MKNRIAIQSVSSFKFEWSLAKELIKQFLENFNTNKLETKVVEKIETVLGEKKLTRLLRQLLGDELRYTTCEKRKSKEQKANLPKSKQQCGTCRISVC